MMTAYLITTIIIWIIATLVHAYKAADDSDGTEAIAGVITFALLLWAIFLLLN